MHLNSAAALALLSATALAGPLDERAVKQPKKKNFSFKQVPSNSSVAPPIVQVMRTHQKFAKNGIPLNLKAATRKNTKLTASVSATPYSNDLAYLVPVTIAGTKFDLNFDTGSADLWTYSNLQPSSQQSGHAIYNPKKSGTLKSGQSWSITYGDGSGAAGVVYADTVTVGSMTATGQAVEAATSVSSDFLTDTTSDGIVGLGFQSINTVSPKQQSTFFDTIGSQLDKKLFAVALKKGAPGVYDFGVINTSRYSGSINYQAVTKGGASSFGYWLFSTLNGFSVGTGPRVSGNLGDAVVDTGTTLMYLPGNVVSAYYAKVSGSKDETDTQGGFTFPCKSTLPNLNLQIGSTYYSISSSFINYSPLPSNSSQCFGGLQSSDDIGMNILGDVFLKALYVVFDAQNSAAPRLGFAAQR